MACPGDYDGPGTDTSTTEDATGSTATTTSAPTSSASAPGTTESQPDPTTFDAVTTDNTTADIPAICGDGSLDSGEECDDGENNADYGPCTTTCTMATCGDGLVWAGVEDCDLGEQNGVGGSGCSETCEELGHCGDEIRDPALEECDAGDQNGAGYCTDTCSLAGLVVFVTSESVSGNLSAYSPDFDGLDGADNFCRNQAQAAKLHDAERFMAWVSAPPDRSPATRFPQAVFDADLPFVLTIDGEVVADNWTDLVDGQLAHAIDRTEFGDALTDAWVWTNTSPTGELDSLDTHCDGWTSAAGTLAGRAGLASATGPAWTAIGQLSCNLAGSRLYCVEMPTPMN